MSEVQSCMKKGNPDPNSKMYEDHERSMLQEGNSVHLEVSLPAVPVDAAVPAVYCESARKRETYVFLTLGRP